MRESRSAFVSFAPGAPSAPWSEVCAASLFLLCAAIIVARRSAGGLFVEDDAWYYIVVAGNVARHGISSFDGQALTNGYHPLWLALLSLQQLLIGPSLFVTLLLEAALMALGAWLQLRAGPSRQGLPQAVFICVFALLFGSIGLDGMEVALLIFCVGLFVAGIRRAQDAGSFGGVLLGLAAAACVGARIDSAFFILPTLIAAPVSRRDRLTAIAVLAGLGLAYAALNLAVFGVAMPVSSTIKSLGGLQLNQPLLDQFNAPFDLRRHLVFYGVTFISLILSPLLVVFAKPGTLARALAWGAAVGGGIYLVKLILLSSWRVWPWYNFAVLFPLLAAYYLLSARADPWLAGMKAGFDQTRRRRIDFAIIVAGMILLGSLAGLMLRRPLDRDNGFATLNHLAIQRYGAVLGGARVAMGDRAGSFAGEYPGPVVQLEGLVNDKAYMTALAKGGDIRPLLCRRGVAYIVDYEGAIGDYDRLRVPVLRPNLTQFRSPYLDVWRSDEVGRVADPAIYDNRAEGGAGDNSLYIWRLRCG